MNLSNDPAVPNAGVNSETKATSGVAPTEPFKVFDVWKEYEGVAMHFNDLLMRLRTQSLAGVAAVATLASLVAKGDISSTLRWGILSSAFALLTLFWIAVWILDFLYYNRLLLGAVDALRVIEKLSLNSKTVEQLMLSTRIEKTVADGLTPGPHSRGSGAGRWCFYIIVGFSLAAGLAISLFGLCGHELVGRRTVYPQISGTIVDNVTKSAIENADILIKRQDGGESAKVSARRNGKFVAAAQHRYFPVIVPTQPNPVLITVTIGRPGYQPTVVEFDHYETALLQVTNLGELRLQPLKGKQ